MKVRILAHGNFLTFMQKLRTAMKKSRYVVRQPAKAPSSYWYIWHFDIVSLSRTLDWTNVITYDLHGTWDGNDRGWGPSPLRTPT
jgi:chitinase